MSAFAPTVRALAANEIIRLVERSARPAKWTLDKLGVPRRTFYRWYDRYLTEGADGLVDRAPVPKIVWNGITDNIREDLHKMALDKPELSLRELAVAFTDTKGYIRCTGSNAWRQLHLGRTGRLYRRQ